MTRIGNLVVFAANDAAGDELWRTDGTAAAPSASPTSIPAPRARLREGF